MWTTLFISIINYCPFIINNNHALNQSNGVNQDATEMLKFESTILT